MTPSQIRLLADARLSDAARVLGLHLSLLGEGDHELAHDALAALLHGTPNGDTVGRHMRQLIVHGYVKRTSKGGSGSPRYEWSARENSRGEASLPAKIHGEKPPIDDEDDDVSTPIVPLLVISPEADQAMEKHAGVLTGCRGALRDYLRRRVPRERQPAYIHDLAGKLGGLGFNWRNSDGRPIPKAEWSGLLAAAINELAATDEASEYRYKPGDPRNLRTKLGILVGQWGRERKATGTDGKPRSNRSGQASDTQEYRPTNVTPELNG